MQQYTISPIISAKRRQEVIILLFHIQQWNSESSSTALIVVITEVIYKTLLADWFKLHKHTVGYKIF
jgi:hypothetical protein